MFGSGIWHKFIEVNLVWFFASVFFLACSLKRSGCWYSSKALLCIGKVSLWPSNVSIFEWMLQDIRSVTCFESTKRCTYHRFLDGHQNHTDLETTVIHVVNFWIVFDFFSNPLLCSRASSSSWTFIYGQWLSVCKIFLHEWLSEPKNAKY